MSVTLSFCFGYFTVEHQKAKWCADDTDMHRGLCLADILTYIKKERSFASFFWLICLQNIWRYIRNESSLQHDLSPTNARSYCNTNRVFLFYITSYIMKMLECRFFFIDSQKGKYYFRKNNYLIFVLVFFNFKNVRTTLSLPFALLMNLSRYNYLIYHDAAKNWLAKI